MTEPMPATEFVHRIRAAGEERYWHKHPFHERLHAGQASQVELRTYVVVRTEYHRRLPEKDGILVTKIPSPEDRREWAKRILNQAGSHDDPGGWEEWLILAESLGLGRADAIAGTGVPARAVAAVEAYVRYCREMDWRLGVAASLTELFAPDLMRRRIAAIEQSYPFVDRGALRYFDRQIERTPQHSDHALDLVVRSARTLEDQEAAIEAVSFKCDSVLWPLLDAMQEAQ